MALLSLSDQEFHRVEQTWRRWGHLWFLVCILSLFLPVYISNLVENETSTAKCQDKGKCLERLPGASAGRAHGEHCQENIEEVCSHLHGPPPLKWTVLVHQKDWTMGPSTGRTHSLLKTQEGNGVTWESRSSEDHAEHTPCSFVSPRSTRCANNSVDVWIVPRNGCFLGRLLGEGAKVDNLFFTWKTGVTWRKMRRRNAEGKEGEGEMGREHLLWVCFWLRGMFQQGPHWEGVDAFGVSAWLWEVGWY